ncbi:MAG: class I SAM-dependent methyltransferase [Beijerinckiaceae bacterium]
MFALAFSIEGAPYVIRECEPYDQYWLSEAERILHSLFSAKGGRTVEQCLSEYARLTEIPLTPSRRRSLEKAIAGMKQAHVLLGSDDDVSRYDRKMAKDYLLYRPFPEEITTHIVRSAPIARDSRVLDLAGGPGDLAVQLARYCDRVTLMELSGGFVRAARAKAREEEVHLETLQESCNRLAHNSEPLDVVTVSQALHWLDDVAICRGLCKLLRQNGSFFVVVGGFDVPDTHPLAYLFGRKSILGHAPDRSFAEGVDALNRRLTLLFEALHAPDVDRIDPLEGESAQGQTGIVPVETRLYRQSRPFGPGFARGFLSPRHIESSGLPIQEFWADVDGRCRGKTPSDIAGVFNWGLLHFRRTSASPDKTLALGLRPHDLTYRGPSEVSRNKTGQP